MTANINKAMVIAIILFMINSLLLTGCAAEQQRTSSVTEPAEEHGSGEPIDESGGEQLFSMEEIVNFDGQDGRPAYIVVDGVVYDVTDVRQWHSGTHFGFTAGADVTEALGSAAPHGAGLLNQAEIVGRVAD